MHCCHPRARAVELAERLCALVPGDFPKKAWFGTTGSDANDCVSRLLPMATGRRRLISYVGSYHGQTTGSALLSGHQTQATVIGLGNVTKVPYPDPYRCMFGPCSRDGCSLKCLEYVERYALDTISPGDDTAGILIEAVQSDGGEIVPPANYLPALRELCDRHGIWLVLDEVKDGWAAGADVRLRALRHRAGRRDAGKPLGGGLPLSAVVGRRELLDVPTYDLFTLGGSPLPCAAGLAAIEVLEQEDLLANAAARGREFLDGFEALQARTADRRRARPRPDHGRRARQGPRHPRAGADRHPPPGLPPLRARPDRHLRRPARQRHRDDPAADHHLARRSTRRWRCSSRRCRTSRRAASTTRSSHRTQAGNQAARTEPVRARYPRGVPFF